LFEVERRRPHGTSKSAVAIDGDGWLEPSAGILKTVGDAIVIWDRKRTAERRKTA
jgi:hypothetical protein